MFKFLPRTTRTTTNLERNGIYYKYAHSKKKEIRGSCPKAVRRISR